MTVIFYAYDNANFLCVYILFIATYNRFLMHNYRHTENMVNKLESAGLGYHVSASQTYEKIGML